MLFLFYRFTGNYCQNKQECSQDFYGENCSIKCKSIDTCSQHQICNIYGNLTCKDGWGNYPECNLRLIDQNIDPECPNTNSTLPCLNGGSCWNRKCCCLPNFTGTHCELATNNNKKMPTLINSNRQSDPCTSDLIASQCSNKGICIPHNNLTGFYCSCFDGYTGEQCETLINNCVSQPCGNNGACISFLKSFYCKCTHGYTGDRCETQMNPCLSQPCIHGKCGLNDNSNASYTCECESGWSNEKTCNEDINECLLTPCLNNGTCLNRPGTYKCNCTNEFTGEACENKNDFCLSNLCHQNNTLECISDYTLKNYVCNCKPGKYIY